MTFFYTPFKSNYEGKSPRFQFLAKLAMNFLVKFHHFCDIFGEKENTFRIIFLPLLPERVVNGACYSRKSPGRRLECILLCAI